MTWNKGFFIAALACFILAAFGVVLPLVALVPLGLAFLAGGLLA